MDKNPLSLPERAALNNSSIGATAQQDSRSAVLFPVAITALFFLTAGFGFYRHEMWRDEFEIFMELKGAPSFLGLFPHIQPAPNLYYSLLYPIIKLWPYPEVFQFFHLVVITSAVFIFNRYSSFNYHQKILFTFSYFTLFEFGIISRDYSMLLLLLFLLIFLVTRRKKNFILIACGLFLLSNHHLYGLFFSISIFTYLVLNLTNIVKELSPGEKRSLIIAGVILLIGALYVFMQYSIASRWNRYSEFGKAPYFMTLRTVWNAFFPVPETAGIHFWNTNIFPFPDLYPKNSAAAEFISQENMLAAAISLIILIFGLIIFSRKIPVLAAFVLNTSMHLVFLQYLSVFYVRYQGPLFIIFIYNYWLLSSDDKLPYHSCDKISLFFSKSLLVNMRNLASPFVSFILFVQFCVGIFCYIQDVRFPFTASYEAARYIKENKLEGAIMVGYKDYVAQTIAGHIDRSIYYPQSQKFETHVLWLDPNRREDMSEEEVLESALKLQLEKKEDVLLILNVPLPDEYLLPGALSHIDSDLRVRFLNQFTTSIVADERFFLYLIFRQQQLPKNYSN